jgi:hypothetical protein
MVNPHNDGRTARDRTVVSEACMAVHSKVLRLLFLSALLVLALPVSTAHCPTGGERVHPARREFHLAAHGQHLDFNPPHGRDRQGARLFRGPHQYRRVGGRGGAPRGQARFLQTGRMVQARIVKEARTRAHKTHEELKRDGVANRYAELDSSEAWPWRSLPTQAER